MKIRRNVKMMVKPSVTELLTKSENRYELVIATSKRARQIVQARLDEKAKIKKETGSEPVSKDFEESAVTVAANEIAEGKVKIC
jgi:DNA-directed RNA polymerase omega subunit